ncbi:histidine kinase [Actinocrispum wychmicini]|uniref:histidine kinase n=1 Tax=Actinocrispum wychmicini TaxID=1213861 RepID=A0A4R2JE87_9PSEU|nr:histidine kinase [Actinocrispum wychmicini]TCO52565.1 signal transduction histidine kinase [Actinocrispum wychmicini]
MRRGWLRLAPTAILVVALFAAGDHRSLWSAGLALAAVVGTLPLVWLSWMPTWIVTTGLVLLTLAGLAMSIEFPNGFGIALSFVAAWFAVRTTNKLTAVIVLPVSFAAILASNLARDQSWLDLVAAAAGLAAVVLAGVARRQRNARIEQTELALARAQTAREEHARAAALAERARIAREMHDVLAHSLAGLALNLQGARLVLVRDGASEEAIQQVERAQRLATDGLAEARRAVAALRSDRQRSVKDLAAQYGPDANLQVIGDAGDLPEDAEDTLYRAAQETLTNVRKHAPGAKVEIRLEHGDHEVALTVTNHGGRRAAPSRDPGYGLTGMRERAQLLGGTFEAGPVEDGWRVHLTVPR